MRKGDLVAASICLLTAFVVLYECVPHYFGDRGQLGSGAFPTYVALLLLACGLSILAQWISGNRKTDSPPFFPTGRGGRMLAYTSASLVLHRIGTDILGFSLASLLLMLFQMRTLGKHRWWVIAGLSLAFVGLVSYIFREWLYMGLPRGVLGI